VPEGKIRCNVTLLLVGYEAKLVLLYDDLVDLRSKIVGPSFCPIWETGPLQPGFVLLWLVIKIEKSSRGNNGIANEMRSKLEAL
jgi:hypothetical protein